VGVALKRHPPLKLHPYLLKGLHHPYKQQVRFIRFSVISVYIRADLPTMQNEVRQLAVEVLLKRFYIFIKE
jgi:hypothetical protein